MTRKNWLEDNGANSGTGDNKSDEQNLWTRRSAMALTAGLLATGAAPVRAAGFQHKVRPHATSVVISKRNRVLAIMNGQTTLKKYRINLGFSPLGHKRQYGDGRTPEGQYVIDRRNPRSNYHLSLGISYPNRADLAKASSAGVDPGGDIFIHGGPVRAQDRNKTDWTAGCVAVSNREIEEIWSLVPTGVPVVIFG